MSRSVSIRWPLTAKRKPTQAEVLTVARDYLGACGTVDEWRGAWLVIKLPGQGSRAIATVAGVPNVHGDAPRWVEVFYGEMVGGLLVDVITRMQDEFTNAVAEGLAEVIAWHWNGKVSR